MKAYVAAMIVLACAGGSYAVPPQRTRDVDQPQRVEPRRAWRPQGGHVVRVNGVPLPAQKVKGTQAPRVAQPRRAAPANDLFANRITIADVTGSIPGNNTDATLEVGEPRYSGNHGSNTVWWTWTAPSAGYYSFDTFGSAFDTTLAIWQGASLATLALLDYNDDAEGTFQSLCVVQAAAGAIYQIQVNGYWADEDFGAITLNWSPVLWNRTGTNAENVVWLTQKGDALQSVARDITEYGTNYFGIEIPCTFSASPLAVSIADKNGKKMVDNQLVPNVTNGAWIAGFDGKQVMVLTGAWGWWTWNSGQGEVFVYKVAKGGLTQVGSATIASNAYEAWLVPGGIYVSLYDNTSMSGLQLWHKNLKKVLWELPLVEGWFDKIYDKGVSFFNKRDIWTGRTNEITIRKKTKKLGALTLTEPAGSWLRWRTDDKGGVLHWTTLLGTNGPLTLVKPDGKKVFENFTPAGLETFAECLYNGKQIWFRKGDYGATATLASYKPGTQPTLNGDTTVANYDGAGIRGANSYSVSYSAGTSTVRGHDKKLVSKWDKTQAGWLWDFFDKDVYCILNDTPTTENFLMYKKNKDFCTHAYPVPE